LQGSIFQEIDLLNIDDLDKALGSRIVVGISLARLAYSGIEK